MISQKIICDRCGTEVDDRGFSVTFSADNGFGIDIRVGAKMSMERHYCGKQCLILTLNELINIETMVSVLKEELCEK